MAQQWEDIGTDDTESQIAIPGSFGVEKGLKGFGVLAPEDQATDDAFDQTEFNRNEILKGLEMVNRLPPEAQAQARQTLISEQAKLGDKPSFTPVKNEQKWEDIQWEDVGGEKGTFDKYVASQMPGIDKLTKAGNDVADDPLNAALGAVGGLVGGLAQGATWLNKATPSGMAEAILKGQKPSDITKEAQGNADAVFKNILPAEVQKRFTDSVGSKAAQEILALPFMPFEEVAEKLRHAGHDEVADAFLGAVAGGAMLLPFKGRGIKKAKAASEESAGPTTGGDIVDSLIDSVKEPEAPAANGPYPAELEASLYDKARQDAVKRGFTEEQANPYASDINNEFHTRQGNLDLAPDKLPEGQTADLFSEKSQQVAEPKSPLEQAQMDFDSYQRPLDLMEGPAESIKRPVEAPKAPETASLFDAENLREVQKSHEIEAAYRQREEQQIAERKADPIVDMALAEIEPSFGARNLEKITKPISSRGSRGRQRGAVNFGRGEDFAKRLQVLKESSLFLKRGEEHYQPGTQVRLMNGKVGIIQNVTDGRYQIKGLDGKPMDSVPIQGIDYAYRPQTGGLSEGFLKAARKKEGGAINFAALFSKDRPTARDVPVDAGLTKDLIKKALRASPDAKVFASLLRNSIDDPTVYSRSNELWANKDKILKSQEPSAYSQLDEVARGTSSDIFRSLDQVLKEEDIGTLRKKDDVSYAGRHYNAAYVMKQKWWNTKAGKLLNWVISNNQEIVNQSLKVYEAVDKYSDAYRELPHKGRENVIKAAIDFDGVMNDKLVQAGLQWPTRDMLIERGLNEAEVRAYENITKGLDRDWELVEQLFRMRGAPPPIRIPGYFPHYWTGAYRAVLYDGNKAVAMHAFSTKWGRNRFMNQNKGKLGEGQHFEEIDPRADVTSSDLAATISLASDIFAGRKGFDRVTHRLLETLNEYQSRGVTKELLERDAKLAGHAADQGFKSGLLDTAHNNRLLSAYQKYNQDVAIAWANERVTNEVLRPIREKGAFLDETPNLKKYIQEYIDRTQGHDKNHLAIVDEALRSVAIGMGLPPRSLARGIVAPLNGLMNLTKLALSPIYWAANAVQPLVPMGDITRIHADRVARGLPTGADPTLIYAKIVNEWAKLTEGKPSPEVKRWSKWADMNDVVSSFQADKINPATRLSHFDQWTEGLYRTVSQRMEGHNRLATFIGLMHYFKEFMPERAALEASKNQMNLIMGNYERMNVPGMFTNFGTLGDAARPFQTLHNTYMGKFLMQVSQFKEGVESLVTDRGMTKAQAMHLMRPLAVALASYYVMSGLKGMPGSREYDVFARALNAVGIEVPLFQELLRQKGFDNQSIYGILSNTIGFDVGGTFNAPTITESGGMPSLQAAGAVAKLAMNALKMAGGKADDVNWQGFFESVRSIAPPWVIGAMENRLARHHTTPEMREQGIKGPVPNLATGKGVYVRSPYEEKLAAITGKRSIKEVEARDTSAIVKFREQALETKRGQAVKKIVNNFFQEGFFHKKSFEEMVADELKTDNGTDEDTLNAAIAKEIMDRVQDSKTKLLERLEKGNEATKAKRVEILRNLGILPKE